MVGVNCSGSWPASTRPQLVLLRAKLDLSSEVTNAGDEGVELPIPAGVPVRSIAEVEEDVEREGWWRPSIYPGKPGLDKKA